MRFSLYGFLIGTGVLVGASIAAKILEERHGDGDRVWEALWWILIPGVVGARAYHVIDQWSYYSADLLLIPQIWLGGFGIFGGIIGGFLGLFFYSILRAMHEEKRVEEVFFLLGDVMVMGTVLAQAIGRWGNYYNNEVYGRQTDLPWGIEVAGKIGRYHPLFLYESILDLTLFVILLFVYKSDKLNRGTTFGSYLIGYGIIRFILDSLRRGAWQVGNIQVARIMGGVFVVMGILVLRRRHAPFYVEGNGEI